jgi:hypothetical protein
VNYILQKQVLPDYSFELFEYIKNQSDFETFYLAGGTALSLILGHRISVDLDFFTDQEFLTNIITNLSKNKQCEVLSLHNNSIELIIDKTKVFFFYFGFSLKYPLIKFNKLELANPIDVGLMKLLALQGRTTRKDIVDLYFIDKKVIKLEKLLEIFENHYPKESFNSYNSLKVLLNIDELQFDPMPIMLIKSNWDKMLNLVTAKIATHVKNLLAK